VGVDAELDRFTGFVSVGLCFGIHRLSGWRLSPRSVRKFKSSTFHAASR
jgi:hypothetical protein